jgi:radical SAM protein with 4Fe4S-binding SPASM domain
MYSKYWDLSAPVSVHVEVTEKCNEKCRHCYNFLRDGSRSKEIGWTKLKNTIDELKKNNVFHCIVTGGEPLLSFEKTLYLIKSMTEAGISVSLNSNLMIATETKMAKLKEAGLPHVLTTLHSYKAETHDFISSTPGSFSRVLRGIVETQNAGVRVTVNTIVLDNNKDDILDIARLVNLLGVNKYMANRCIPSGSNEGSKYLISTEDARKMESQLVKARRFMDVDTCRHLPECFTSEFPGRGCAAGKRHMLINIDGTSHGCVHEQTSYGNIHDVGLAKVWKDMKKAWLSFVPDDCRKCPRVHTCMGGCRMCGFAATGKMNGKDNLCVGNATPDKYLMSVRQENGFKLFRTVGAKVNCIDD